MEFEMEAAKIYLCSIFGSFIFDFLCRAICSFQLYSILCCLIDFYDSDESWQIWCGILKLKTIKIFMNGQFAFNCHVIRGCIYIQSINQQELTIKYTTF